MVSYEKQKIPLGNVPNARQLGGYIGTDGRKVKNNTVIRCGMLFGCSDEVCNELSEKYSLSDVIDFRMPKEAKMMPDPEIKGAKYHHISVLNNIPVTKEDLELFQKILKTDDMGSRYKMMFDTKKYIDPIEIYKDLVFSKEGIAGYKKYFDILLNKPDNAAVLFHCTQGKDRTGVAAMLLLTALGVDRGTVIADYLLTNVACEPILNKIRTEVPKTVNDPKVIEFALFFESVNEKLANVLFDGAEKEYGSVNGYLQKEIGITKADIERLNELYLEKK